MKKSKKRKDGDCKVCRISSTTGIKGIRSYFKHTSLVKYTLINRSDKDAIVIDFKKSYNNIVKRRKETIGFEVAFYVGVIKKYSS